MFFTIEHILGYSDNEEQLRHFHHRRPTNFMRNMFPLVRKFFLRVTTSVVIMDGVILVP
jgi:hypothetical protein